MTHTPSDTDLLYDDNIETQSMLGRATKFIIKTFIILSLILINLTITPWILSILSIWERREQTSSFNLTKDPSIEYYQYKPSPQPEPPLWKKALNFLASCLKIMLFPLYLYGLGLKIIIGSIIYPLTIKNHSIFQFLKMNDDDKFYPLLKRSHRFETKKCFIEMPNQVILHSYELMPKKALKNELKNTPHILYFPGNGDRYENKLNYMCSDAIRLNAKVIGFHFSNYGNSGRLRADGTIQPILPRSQSEIVEEGIAQVQRLLDKGIPAEKIFLHGHSLGGGIATLVTWHFHQQTPPKPINLYNDRSFSSISNVAAAYISPKESAVSQPRIGQRMLNALWTTIAFLLQPIFKLALYLADWDINAGAVFQKIPATSKNYSVIRKKVNGPIPIVISDHMIPYEASIHRATEVKAARKKEKQGLPAEKRNRIQGDHKFFHRAYDIEDEFLFTQNHNLHNVHSSHLINRFNLNGSSHFRNFIRKSCATTEHHSRNARTT